MDIFSMTIVKKSPHNQSFLCIYLQPIIVIAYCVCLFVLFYLFSFRQVMSYIIEACIGELPVSYIPGSKQESILYPFK